MQIERLNHGLYKVQIENVSYLGLKVGIHAGRSASRIAALVHEPGLLIDRKSDGIGQWQIAGVAVHEEELILYGPWLSQANSLAALEGLPRSTASRIFLDLVVAYRRLEEKNRVPAMGLYLSALVYTETGTFLVLPESIQKAMLSLTPAQERVPSYDCFHRAGKKGIIDLIFGLDVLFFRIMTGSFPYDNMDHPAHLADWQLSGVLLSPRCLIAAVPDQVETYYRKHFQAGRLDDASIAESLVLYQAWQASDKESGINHDADPDAINAFGGRQAVFRRRQFLKKNSAVLSLSAIGLAIAIVIGITAIGNLVKPPRTAGMSASQVVEAYYGSMNSLDVELMKDTVQERVGQDLVSMGDNLYVISQVRMGTERKNVRMPVTEWIKAGQPPVTADMMLFGIAGLEIKEKEVTANDYSQFIVDYELCTSSAEGYQQPGPGVVPHLVINFLKRQDEVTVMPVGKQGAWIITSIKRLLQDKPRLVPVSTPPATGINQ